MVRMYKRKDFVKKKGGLKYPASLFTMDEQINSTEVVLQERSWTLRGDMSFDSAWDILKGHVRFHARRFGVLSKLNDYEDFEVIGQTVIWKCLEKYKPVCSICGKKYLSVSKYKNHKHNGKVFKPVYSFESFTRMRILSAFQSEIKRETAQKRHPKEGINTFTYEPAVLCNSFRMIDFTEIFNLALLSFDSVQKAIIHMLVSYYSVSDIVLMLEPHGYSLSFVRNTIRRFRKDLKSFYNLKTNLSNVA